MKHKTIINISTKVMVLLWLILILIIASILVDRFNESFNFTAIIWLQFITFSLVGALIALSYLDLTEKHKIGYNHNVVNLVFTTILFIGSLQLVFPNYRIYQFLHAIRLFSFSGRTVFQILFGYSFMQLFIKK